MTLASVRAARRAAKDVAGEVRARIGAGGRFDGVVLVGGYGVVPSQRVGCVPPGVHVDPAEDLDRFIVWCDDVYGDTDGDGAPELPVSRVPDGGSLAFLRRALSPGASASASRAAAGAFGLRSTARPYADAVFRRLSARAMQTSLPVTPRSASGVWTGGARVYLSLHGIADDAARCLGEDPAGATVEALLARNVPHLGGAVVLAACCWGALIVDTAAVDARPETRLRARTPARSIALTALARGARAFVGPTALHYSPTTPASPDASARATRRAARDRYGYFGKPLHDAFWRAHLAGAPPARALFVAKKAYLKGIPHGLGDARGGPVSARHVAIECKILRAFTCLGIGW